MPLPQADAHAREQSALSALVGRRVLQLWQLVPTDAIDTWSRLLPTAVGLVTAAQLAAASRADTYVTAALAAQRVDVDPIGRVNPAAFTGRASDGRDLTGLLDQPRIAALTDIQAGAAATAAVTSAGNRLLTMTLTQVADAGRQADSVAIAARPRVGWVRMVTPPCCTRCAILAGRWYRSNAAFSRHARCDCTAVPAQEDVAGDVGTDPGALFRSGQVRGLNRAETRAVADGADPAQVVNARRGRSRDGMSTTEGTTRRGFAGARRSRTGVTGARPTPDAIYRVSTSPEDARRLLLENGYLV